MFPSTLFYMAVYNRNVWDECIFGII